MQDLNTYINDSFNKLSNSIKDESEKLVVDMIFYINSGNFDTYKDYVNYVNEHNNDTIEYQRHNLYTISIPLPLFSEKLYSYIKRYTIWKDKDLCQKKK